MGRSAVSECKAYYHQILLSNKSYALIDMNIKKFRYMNYMYGRKAADRLLFDLKKTIQKSLHSYETIIHINADNFILFISYESKEKFEKERLVSLTDLIFDIDNEYAYHNIYTSFGIYFIESKQIEFDEAYEKAHFSRIMCDSLDRRVFSYEIYKTSIYDNYMYTCYLEEYTAKAKPQGMYQVYIQPKIDLKTRKIIGGEALIRLIDHGKIISPIEFLPMLNKNGFIRLIDLFVFETVVKAVAERMRLGQQNVRISFNISNSFCKGDYFVNDYQEIIKKYNVNTDYLEIEFLESITIDKEHLKSFISDFHNLGFCCSLDDFGNGYSNFNLLLDNNLDVIKIDRCFFRGSSEDVVNYKILKTIINLIKDIGKKVIAEGVERKEDVDFLASLGCDAVQGFYFYKPMPMNEFFLLIDNQ